MILRYQKFIARADLRANSDTIYVFGDNLEESGYGGQAAEMRGEPNALGIPTKRSPSAYLQDQDLRRLAFSYHHHFGRLNEHLKKGREIVFPSDGIGTGLADLQRQSPLCWALLQLFMTDFINTVEQRKKELQDV